MATTAAVARNLLRNSKSLPQILRGQILDRSNYINNMAKEHQIAQSLFVSNQKMHAQIPIFDFSEMGSLVGSSGRLSLAEEGDGRGMRGFVVEARGKRVVSDDDDDFDEVYEYGRIKDEDIEDDFEDFVEDADSDDFYSNDEDDDGEDDMRKRM
ncbi:Uncharacterized protein TCM_031496 [Theobroma cacao]|uniref:Uncharacterized protein n=1 Tax=Theobroma cacao TaxID=3641 RepID=A0A061F7G6_THECC|nr:Uncharacterized protein TCM_031496 [Theobroma cacao]